MSQVSAKGDVSRAIPSSETLLDDPLPSAPPCSELHLLTRVQGEKRFPTCVSAICVTAFADRLPSCGPGRLLRNRRSQQDRREVKLFTSSKV